MKLKVGQHIHLVGIGGSGLSAIARILLEQGYTVSGSDRSLNSLTEALARDGATIYEGHSAAYIKGADALIITSAVKPDHVEVTAAVEQGIPVYKRQDIIADLMEGKKVIAVAGTKGKTTTTSMIVHILRECGYRPSYIVGGVMGNTGTNASVDNGVFFVIEADEYENMFLGIRPHIAVVTNVEWDHPDFFKTHDEMLGAFRTFTSQLRPFGGYAGGVLIACADERHAYSLLEARTEWNHAHHADGMGVIAYSIEEARPPHPSYLASHVRLAEEGETFFDIELVMGETRNYITSARLPMSGFHNIQNALAAFSVARLIYANTGRLDERYRSSQVVAALASFKPPARRFEVRADVNQIAVVDDYAHNPLSIRAVLQAARQRYPGRTVWAVWQPHTYSRTQALMGDYVKSFDSADHVLLTDIYAARENPIEGVTSAAVVAVMQHPDARHTPTFEDTVRVLCDEVKAPAVILIMSAGDAPQIGVEYLKQASDH
jgi:UDP-N-acetylmuramate--alanine ligase